MLNSFFHKGLLHFELLSLDPRDFILLNLVGAVALKLIVGEFVLGGDSPCSEASEYFVGLGGRVYILLLHFLQVDSFLSLRGDGGLFCSFLLLLIFFLLFLFFGFGISTLFLVVLLFVI